MPPEFTNWYDGFLSHDDQTLNAEEYEAMISFAKAKMTPLQSIVKYGSIVYNLDKGQSVNAKNNPLREKKIETDVHEYRARLKFPEFVHVDSYIAGDGGAISAANTKFDGQTVPTGQGVIKLSTYSQAPSGPLSALKEARAITENLALENQTTHEVYTVIDVDPIGNAILVRMPSASDGNLDGTVTGGDAPAKSDVLAVQSPGLFERDFASEGNGLELTAKYYNYAQFFDVKYGQSISAEHIRFQGGSVLDAMNTYKNEVMGRMLEVAFLWGQGKYIAHPTDEGNRQQFMQGVIPALMYGPAAGDCGANQGLVTNINGPLTIANLNEALDRINLVDASNAPCLVSKRFIRAVNALDRDKVRTTFRETAAGLQILRWTSDFGIQEFIYEPYLDDRKTFLPDGTTQATVDCIKYDMASYAKLCKLVPLTIRTDIGKYSGSTMLYTWMYTILTAEWGHPECGGLICNVA